MLISEVPEAEELFSERALLQVRDSLPLKRLVHELRQREGKVATRLRKIDTDARCRSCLEVIAEDLAEGGLSVPGEARDKPERFFEVVCSYPFAPSTGVVRRRAREVSRVVYYLWKGGLDVPHSQDDLRLLWEQAMLGEPRWSEDYPSSELRQGEVAIRRSLLEPEVLHQCMDAAQVPVWLDRLFSFLSDERFLPEVRAVGGLCLHDWIHPFRDGNGHVGRFIELGMFVGNYSLPTVAFLARELVNRRQVTMKQFRLLRERKTDVSGFCLGMLRQVQDAQMLVLKRF